MFRLIYSSHSRIAPGDSKPELGDIFATARRNNKRLDVTGALVVTGDAFAQALEGEDGGPDIRLVSNADKRVIVAAGAAGHVTPEQEALLARMRESIASEAPA